MSSTTTGSPIPTGSGTPRTGRPTFRYYHYEPSLAGEIVFIVLFSIATIGHLAWIVRKKTWYFIPFLIGCLFEAIGYAGRAVQANQTPKEWSRGPYILQTLTILLGPALIAASIYMVLGRTIRMLDAAHLSLVRVTWLTKIFVAGDVLSFVTQGLGGGILASADGDQSRLDLGNNIILVGLGIQVVVFGLFIITTILFHLRITKTPTARSFGVTTPWQRLIYVLYFSSALIMVRSIFRMIEYGLGWDNVLMQSELYIFLLDGALMVLTAFAFLFYHPGRVLIGYKQGKSAGGEAISGESGSDDYNNLGSRGGESQYHMTDMGNTGSGYNHQAGLRV